MNLPHAGSCSQTETCNWLPTVLTIHVQSYYKQKTCKDQLLASVVNSCLASKEYLVKDIMDYLPIAQTSKKTAGHVNAPPCMSDKTAVTGEIVTPV